jgi:hypothetical protein
MFGQERAEKSKVTAGVEKCVGRAGFLVQQNKRTRNVMGIGDTHLKASPETRISRQATPGEALRCCRVAALELRGACCSVARFGVGRAWGCSGEARQPPGNIRSASGRHTLMEIVIQGTGLAWHDSGQLSVLW